MNIDEIKIIGVVGAGTMGRGIAQVAVESGFNVLLYDSDPSALQNSVARLKKWWRSSVQDKYTSDLVGDEFEREVARRLNILTDRLKVAESLEELKDADFVIEAVVENLTVKQNIFWDLDLICRFDVVLATNTSSIPIIEIARATNRGDKVMGMHFMNPPPLVTLVELIKSCCTSKETIDLVKNLSLKLNRSPIIESADRPGFIVNLVLMTAINEAAKAVQTRRGTREDVNKSIIMGVGGSKGMGMPILELADLIGLDVCLNILNIMKRRPCALLKKMVQEGFLGRKSGKGFFDYAKK